LEIAVADGERHSANDQRFEVSVGFHGINPRRQSRSSMALLAFFQFRSA
jgi:hypothetical protein